MKTWFIRIMACFLVTGCTAIVFIENRARIENMIVPAEAREGAAGTPLIGNIAVRDVTGAFLLASPWTASLGILAIAKVGGTKLQEAEYSRLKGEHDALVSAASEIKCPLDEEGVPGENW